VSIRDILRGEGEKNMNTIKVVYTQEPTDNGTIKTTKTETTQQPEQTRVRFSFTVSAKGKFQGEITSEADTLATGIENLNHAIDELEAIRKMCIATGKLGVTE
jgi:hypothetical protein